MSSNSEDKYKFPPDPALHWKNRRRMAWLSLWGAVLYPILVLFTESESLAAISPHYYLFATVVVTSYLGFTAWADKTLFKKDEE